MDIQNINIGIDIFMIKEGEGTTRCRKIYTDYHHSYRYLRPYWFTIIV